LSGSRDIHTTIKGRVIYDRRLHHFSDRDAVRVLKKVIGWQDTAYPLGPVASYQQTKLFLFLLKYFLPGFLSAKFVKIDTAPSWYGPVKTALNTFAGAIGVPFWASSAANWLSELLYPHIKEELVLDWGPVLASFWAASEILRQEVNFNHAK